MSTIQKSFYSESFGKLTVFVIDGIAHFPATACAKMLGYSQPASAVDPKHTVMLKPRGGKMTVRFFPLGELREFINRCTLPMKEAFEAWIEEEVLPGLLEDDEPMTGEVSGTAEIIPMPTAKAQEKDPFEVFRYLGEKQVRVIVRDGEPWFVAMDVCVVLEIGNPTQALKRLDDEDKGCLISNEAWVGQQTINIVNEPGLYSLILGSRKPEAKQFKRWITHDVIPAIRKRGEYKLERPQENAIMNPQTVVELAKAVLEYAQKNEELTQQVRLMSPKASYFDRILQNPDTVPVTLIAKDYGMTAKAFNKLLHNLEIQFYVGDTWALYRQYADQGYTHTYTFCDQHAGYTHQHMGWTQKGRLFLYNLLKEKGIVPMIEASHPAVSY